MKGLLKILLLTLLTFAGIPSLDANPFRHRYVCVPELKPDSGFLEFEIRDGGPCEDGTWREVRVEADGTILLMPSEGPLTQEQKRDLENYKSYYGIIR